MEMICIMKIHTEKKNEKQQKKYQEQEISFQQSLLYFLFWRC